MKYNLLQACCSRVGRVFYPDLKVGCGRRHALRGFVRAIYSGAVFLFVGSVMAQIPTSGLVAYYTLDGNANDVTGLGHSGSIINALATSDRYARPNGALAFNGSSAYVAVPDSNDLDLTGADVRKIVDADRYHGRVRARPQFLPPLNVGIQHRPKARGTHHAARETFSSVPVQTRPLQRVAHRKRTGRLRLPPTPVTPVQTKYSVYCESLTG